MSRPPLSLRGVGILVDSLMGHALELSNVVDRGGGLLHQQVRKFVDFISRPDDRLENPTRAADAASRCNRPNAIVDLPVPPWGRRDIAMQIVDTPPCAVMGIVGSVAVPGQLLTMVTHPGNGGI